VVQCEAAGANMKILKRKYEEDKYEQICDKNPNASL
jgi:hypothetical protein